jgi:hypothetical protein
VEAERADMSRHYPKAAIPTAALLHEAMQAVLLRQQSNQSQQPQKGNAMHSNASKGSIHRHEFRNIAGQVVEVHVDLARIIALDYSDYSSIITVVVDKSKPFTIYSNRDEYHRLLAAWLAFNAASREGGAA